MATIHPSRLGLVPHTTGPPSRDRNRGRSPSPRRATDEGHQSHSRGERDSKERGDGARGGRGDPKRERARADDYFDEGQRKEARRDRSRSVDRQRDREREEMRGRDRPRRPSPEYSEYRRPSPPHASAPSAPWQQQNMYPDRRERPPHPGNGGTGNDYLESRRQQREASTLNVWPPSPKAPARSSLSPDGKRHRHSKKRHRHDDTDESSDDEDRRRSDRKSKKKHRKEKEKSHDKEKEHRHHRRSRSKSVKYDSEDHDARRKSRTRTASEERQRSKDRPRAAIRSPGERPPTSDTEDDWVERPADPTLPASTVSTKGTGSSSSKPLSATVSGILPATSTNVDDGDGDGDEVGPQPLYKASSSKKIDERQYGGALLRGEGSAMAAFLKDGTDVRIPRRGEIGLTSDEIATFESVGYVMSGSRHKRMNAVRMRKENQVISAEEKRGILKLQQEERARREAILREEFQELVKDNLKAQGAAP